MFWRNRERGKDFHNQKLPSDAPWTQGERTDTVFPSGPLLGLLLLFPWEISGTVVKSSFKKQFKNPVALY